MHRNAYNMGKIYASLNSKINGLNSITLILSNLNEESYVIDLDYSKYDFSYYSKEFTSDKIKKLIEFLEHSLK